ncbi:Putrescine importer PuuP [Serratia fonticola]|uniref:Putrescine importer PuuP n=1 Tax=Serratia fonticola TaxID=47917 RepID=A0A4U9W7Y8_SERFO|nr:Putrescine importer PuuP [Serratia fonticola]
MFILGSIASVSALNILGVRLLSSVNFTLIALQMVFIVLFIVLAFSEADLSPASLMKPLLVDAGDFSGLIAGAAVLCLAFLGFDAIATMAEEAADAKRYFAARDPDYRDLCRWHLCCRLLRRASGLS